MKYGGEKLTEKKIYQRRASVYFHAEGVTVFIFTNPQITIKKY